MRNRSFLGLLVCLNLALLTGLLLAGYRPPSAHAQATGLAGNYLVVTGEIQDNYDSVYMINLEDRVLYALYYDRGTRRLELGGARDLEKDFRNKE